MKMILSLIVAVLIIPVCSQAIAKQKPPFYDRAMAAIGTPDACKSQMAERPASQPSFTNIDEYPDGDPRFRKKPWFESHEAADPRKIGIGLTIAGSIVTALGGGIIYYASQLHSYTANGIYHRVYPEGYYLLGVMVTGGGLGMLIPGIVKLARGR